MRIAAQQAPPTRSVQPVMRGVSLPMASQQREYAGNQAALRRLSPIAPRLQPRLAIGSVSDPLEAEADRAADQVMRSPIPSQPLVQRKCSSCEEEDETLQRKQDGPVMDAIDAPPIVHRALAAPGRPLDRETRDFFEQRYAQDFSQVRIHADAVAADSAASIRAHAYTAGRHIAFAHDRYQPHTPAGRHLLAHELAHVVQQGGGGVAAVRRLGDVTQVPLTLPCPVAASNAPQAQDFLLFPNNSSTLSDAQKNQLAAFANRWSTDGGGATIRIDGFASEPGGQPQNWQLSCDRAGAVKDALVNPPIPQVGIPESSINLFMQGETAEFGADALNRRVTLSFPTPQPVPPPPSQQDPVPTPTPTPDLPPAGPPRNLLGDSACARTGACPEDYCLPFATQEAAMADRAANGESVLSKIGVANSSAVPLFRAFVFNPAPAGDISATFAADFTRDDTTVAMAREIKAMLEAEFATNPPTFPGGSSVVTVNLNTLPALSLRIRDMLNRDMTFSNPLTVPGLIAGGIGKTQESCRVGANLTGAVNDSRAASGTVEVIRQPDGSLLVTPEITFTVVDTLDFCPGNCGGAFAQSLTVPLSRWEASFISGDVPFTVTFPAPTLVGSAGSE